MRPDGRLFVLVTALIAAPPGAAEHGAQEPLPTVEIAVDAVPLTVEVADEPREREHGLMHRSALDEGHGMLFVYPNDRPRVFWMRHTPLALDAGFIGADGRLDEIVPLVPESEALVTSRGPARYVLEVPRGWFATHGIAPGVAVSGLPGR